MDVEETIGVLMEKMGDEPEEIKEEQEQEELPEENEDEVVDTPEEESETDDDEEVVVDEEDDEDVETYLPKTLEDLVESFDGDDESVKNLVVARKKNGEPVSLEQVLANWDISEAATRKSQEASELKKQLEEERNTVNAQLFEKYQEQTAILGALEELYTTFGEDELKALRDVNPAEYAARKAELSEQQQQLDSIKQKIRAEQEVQSQQQQQMYYQQQQQIQAREREALLSKVPDWQNPETFKSESAELINFLQDFGYSKQEIGSVIDHRALLLARDALKYHNIKDRADPKKKRVVKKPRNVRASPPQTKIQKKQAASKKTMEKVRRSGGHINDVAAALYERM